MPTVVDQASGVGGFVACNDASNAGRSAAASKPAASAARVKRSGSVGSDTAAARAARCSGEGSRSSGAWTWMPLAGRMASTARAR